MNHLLEMDYARRYRAAGDGTADPPRENKTEAYEMFVFLVEEINHAFLLTNHALQVCVRRSTEVLAQPVSYSRRASRASFAGALHSAAASLMVLTDQISSGCRRRQGWRAHGREGQGDPFANVGRNDPCPVRAGASTSIARRGGKTRAARAREALRRAEPSPRRLKTVHMIEDRTQEIQAKRERIWRIGEYLHLDSKRAESHAEEKAAEPGFWDHPSSAQSIMSQAADFATRRRYEAIVATWRTSSRNELAVASG